MSTWAGRIITGLLSTAVVVGAAGGVGAVGGWWVPVVVGSLLGAVTAGVASKHRSRLADTELSGLAAVLDGQAWTALESTRPAA